VLPHFVKSSHLIQKMECEKYMQVNRRVHMHKHKRTNTHTAL